MADKEIQTYRDRVTVAKNFYKQKRKAKITRWNKLWRGEYSSTTVDTDTSSKETISANYIYSTIKNKVASLYYKNPKIIVEAQKEFTIVEGQMDAQGQPLKQDNIVAAKNIEQLLNYQMREYDIKTQVRRALLDWKRFGYGTIFTGWITSYKQAKKTIKGQTGKLLPNSQSFKLAPSIDKTVDTQDIESLDEDRIDIRRIRPDHIYFSPDCIDRDDINNHYVVLEVVMPYEKFQKNPEFKKLGEPTQFTYVDSEYRETSSAYGNVGDTEDMKRVRLFYYYDQENEVILLEHGEKMIKNTNPYAEIFGKNDALPVVLIFGDDHLDEFYPGSDISILEYQQIELAKVRAQQINHNKRFNRSYLYDRTKIAEEDVEVLKEPYDGLLVPVDPKDGPINNLMTPVPDANLQYPFQMEQRIIDDINVVSGVNQYQRGDTGKAPDTLGQTQIVEAHSQSRRDEEQQDVEDFVRKIYRRMLQLDQEYLQETVYVKIVGEDAQNTWKEISNGDIKGEFDLIIESGSTAKLDDDVIRKQALDAFNLVYQTPEATRIRKDLIVSLLDTMPSLKGVAEKLKNIPEDQLLPPPPKKDPSESMQFSVDKILPLLTPEDQAQVLSRFGIQSQGIMPPQPQAPLDQGMALDPQQLGQGTPSISSILQGVNNVRG